MGEADPLVRRFEAEVREAAPQISEVHVHIEPVEDGALEQPAEAATSGEEAAVREILGTLPGAPPPVDLRVVRVDGALRISFRWELSPEAKVASARERGLEAERRLRARLPHVGRVLIRLETAIPP
jgi:divalent metal cation (Fe/Co/Zn/Cd) transporter